MEIEYVEIIAFVLSTISTLAIIIPYMIQLDSPADDNLVKSIKLEKILSIDPTLINCNDVLTREKLTGSNNTIYDSRSLCEAIKYTMSGNIDSAIENINNIKSLNDESKEFQNKFYYILKILNIRNDYELVKINQNNSITDKNSKYLKDIKINFNNIPIDSKKERNFTNDSCMFEKSCIHKTYYDIRKIIKDLETEAESFDLYFKKNENYISLFSLKEIHNKFINDFNLFIMVSFIAGPIIFILITRLYHLKESKSNKDKVNELR